MGIQDSQFLLDSKRVGESLSNKDIEALKQSGVILTPTMTLEEATQIVKEKLEILASTKYTQSEKSYVSPWANTRAPVEATLDLQEKPQPSPARALQKKLKEEFKSISPSNVVDRRTILSNGLASLVALSLYAIMPNRDLSSQQSSQTTDSAEPVEQAPQRSPEFLALKAQAHQDTNDYRDMFIRHMQGKNVAMPNLDDMPRSMPFEADKKTIVILDPGHGMRERGTERVKFVEPNNEGMTQTIHDRLTEKLQPLLPNKNVGQILAQLQYEMTGERIRDAREKDYKIDGWFNWVDMEPRLISALGVRDGNTRYRVREAAYAYFHEDQLALSESEITSVVAQEVSNQLADEEIVSVFTRDLGLDDPMWNPDNPIFDHWNDEDNKLERIYQAQMRLRTETIRYLAQKYNVVGIALHADSNGNPNFSDSMFYKYDDSDATPMLLAQALKNNWKQSQYHNPNTDNQVRQGNFKLIREAVNTILAELFQMGNSDGRTRADKVLKNEDNAREYSARTIVTAIKDTLSILERHMTPSQPASNPAAPRP